MTKRGREPRPAKKGLGRTLIYLFVSLNVHLQVLNVKHIVSYLVTDNMYFLVK